MIWLLLALFLFYYVIKTILIKYAPVPRPPTRAETQFVDLKTGLVKDFPRLIQQGDGPGNVSLSLIVPAYNEEKRLGIMLDETLKYLSQRQEADKNFVFELILVDDGSKDKTIEVAKSFAKDHHIEEHFRIMKLEQNRGKGGAVTQGMLAARGELLLFVDADGATRISDLDVLEKEIRKISGTFGLGVAVGSRAHMVKTDAVVKASIRSIKDTQCGFKLFTRKAGQSIFPNVHVQGWIFDIELLLLAEMLKIPVVEVPVNWHEVEGSKISLMKDSIKMLVDLITIRLCYILGVWTVDGKQKLQ